MKRKKIKLIHSWIKIVLGKTNASVRQDIGRIYSIESVKGYYNDMTDKIAKGFRKDTKGIPMVNIGEKEMRYFPIAIMNFGLAYYDLYLLNHLQDDYSYFLKIADWCRDNLQNDGSWDCFGPVQSSKYTVSSLGQGLGASLLIRAYVATNRSMYLDCAKKAIDFMLQPIEDGGTTYYGENGKIFLEEYPQKEKRSVLNGWIFSIFGIWDYYCVTKDKNYYKVMIRTKNTLIDTLKLYDMEYWSYYDLCGMIASPHYQFIHSSLLQVMYEMFGDNEFLNYSIKWKQDYNNICNKAKAVFLKLIQKMKENVDVVAID